MRIVWKVFKKTSINSVKLSFFLLRNKLISCKSGNHVVTGFEWAIVYKFFRCFLIVFSIRFETTHVYSLWTDEYLQWEWCLEDVFWALRRSSISDTEKMFFETLQVEKTSFKVKRKEKEDKKLKRAIQISHFLFFKKFSWNTLN